ncbi:MAG: substrate-binding domain-containing protein [Anaerolineaceae bacterium]
MDEAVLYKRIADSFRKQIFDGVLKPGDRLPSIRELTQSWNCTPGTVQRAYRKLAQDGLVISRAGQGTRVVGSLSRQHLEQQVPLRRAAMVHQAEAFLLEMLTAGYTLEEVERAFILAMDRWRALDLEAQSEQPPASLRFSGSHDVAVIWVVGHISEIIPGVDASANFTGSLGGLIALAEGDADLAGCHLWDEETQTYNEPYLRKLFPGRTMRITRLADRRLGLILANGNPLGIRAVNDLARLGVRMINRQQGSGTRVWLDAELHRLGIHADSLTGYADEAATHSEVACAVAENRADVGMGLESAANSFGLDFIPLVNEPYELVCTEERALSEPLMRLLTWLGTPAAQAAMAGLKGYDLSHCGEYRTLVL